MSDSVRNLEQCFLVALFPICSLAGLAALLRRGERPTSLEVTSSVLNSGLFGVAVASYMLHEYTIQSWQMILCFSILSGLGGNVLLTFSLTVLQRAIARAVETSERGDFGNHGNHGDHGDHEGGNHHQGH